VASRSDWAVEHSRKFRDEVQQRIDQGLGAADRRSACG
jgi:hypothetical protein